MVQIVCAAPFDIFDEVSDREFGWNRGNQMNMVFDAINRMDDAAERVKLDIDFCLKMW